MNTDRILSYLKDHLDTARFRHTLGTVRVARELAERHGVSPDRAALAALLHDAGKGMPATAMVRYVKRHRVAVPHRAVTIALGPALLHGYISAHIARVTFGVKDAGVLKAIAAHTLGAPRMDALAKIVYLADAIAPDRRHADCKRIRKLAFRDIDEGLRAAMANKLFYVIIRKKWFHPTAVAAWNAALPA